MSTFGTREQLTADVISFQEKAWDLAQAYEARDSRVSGVGVESRDPWAKVINLPGMHVDIGKPPEGDDPNRQVHVVFDKGHALDLESIFSELQREGKIEPDVVTSLSQELRTQLSGVLELNLVVIDNQPCLAQAGQLDPRRYTYRLQMLEQENRLESALSELVGLGAKAPKNYRDVLDRILRIERGRGYRIVGRGTRCKGGDILEFGWNGLLSENKSRSAIHSMEGERSNLIRAALLEGIARRLHAQLPPLGD